LSNIEFPIFKLYSRIAFTDKYELIPQPQPKIERINLEFSDTNPVNPFVIGFAPVTTSPTQTPTTTKKPGINLFQILQMKRNNISQNVINSIVADGKLYNVQC